MKMGYCDFCVVRDGSYFEIKLTFGSITQCSTIIIIAFILWEAGDGIAVRALTSHQCAKCRKMHVRSHDWVWFGFPLVEKVVWVLLSNHWVY